MARIRLRELLLASICALSLATASPATDSDAPADKQENPANFFVAPITTEVQRSVVSTDATVYAMVNGSGLLRENLIDPSALDGKRFRAELKNLAKGGEPTLRLILRFDGFEEDEGAEQFLGAAIKELCREAGFSKVNSTTMRSSLAWGEFSNRLQSKQDDDAREEIVEEELIRVYPIRTNLSRVLLSDADCVVEIRRPFDGRQKTLSPELRASIAKAIDSLELQTKHVLSFKLSSTDAGEAMIEELFSYKETSPANVFAHELGFKKMNYSHSPNGGAPQELIGKTAPDFVLDTVGGAPLSLRENIKGKVALVTFWGVACGPCVREAPHLSRLFERYGSDDFAVIAVNAYDESQEVVADFVRRESLRHPIVVGGGEVARNIYKVGAYPTTFWISREGVVLDYVIGFDDGDELQIEERIVLMLNDR
jgi:thiol-disulfide isomerase/thioredoxin